MISQMPVRIFFFGAGASKACGFPMASELLDAIRNPNKYNVNLRGTQGAMYEDVYNKLRETAISAIEILSKNEKRDLEKLEHTFNTLTAIREKTLCHPIISSEKASEYFEALCTCISLVLHPRYNIGIDSTPYSDFAYKLAKLPGWSIVISTNWDYLLDGFIDIAAGDILVDWGIGTTSTQLWTGAIDLLAQYCWEEMKMPFISVYKPNGSLNWVHCHADNLIYARHFYDPYNLDQLRAANEHQRIVSTTNNTEYKDLHPFACPKCKEAMKNDALHVPGISRKTHPLYDVMFHYIKKATIMCDEITFIGYSCPKEDNDILEYISDALKENDTIHNRVITPTIVDISGPWEKSLIDRYEHIFQRKISFNNSGFYKWINSED